MATRIDARRGTVLWAINHFRKDGLQAFVEDLRGLEERGLSKKECDHVQDALADVVTAAAGVPAGTYWETNVYSALERFLTAYVLWNNHGPNDAAKRRAELARVRRRKRAISERIAKHQGALAPILETGMVIKMYDALEKVAREMPGQFPQLATAVARFKSRLAR